MRGGGRELRGGGRELRGGGREEKKGEGEEGDRRKVCNGERIKAKARPGDENKTHAHVHM